MNGPDVNTLMQPRPPNEPADDSSIPVVEADCPGLSASPDRKTITAAVQSGQSGLAKIELKLDGNVITRWTRLVAGERGAVIFTDLPPLNGAHRHEMVCGSFRKPL